MRSTIKTVAVLIAVLALFVAACGSASDTVAEKLAEELIEASSDGEVDIDISGDGDDVTMKVETDDGSMSFGSGAEMPEGLEIPVPDDGEVLATITADQVINVSLTYAHGRFDEIVGFYENWISGTGEEWDSQTLTMGSGDEAQRTNMWVENEGNSMIVVTDCPAPGSDTSDLNAVCVTVTQGE